MVVKTTGKRPVGAGNTGKESGMPAAKPVEQEPKSVVCGAGEASVDAGNEGDEAGSGEGGIDVRYRLTQATGGPTRPVTLSLNRWRLALKRLEKEIRVVNSCCDSVGSGIRLSQNPAGSMLETIRRRIGEYHDSILLHRRLLEFQWLLRSRIAAKNLELGINDLLCEQEMTRMRLDLLQKQAMETRNEFRVSLEELQGLFQGTVEGERKITREHRFAAASEGEGDVLDLTGDCVPIGRNVQENWKTWEGASSLILETLPPEIRERLRQEFLALSRRMVGIGDEIAERNQTRLTLEVPDAVAEAIMI